MISARSTTIHSLIYHSHLYRGSLVKTQRTHGLVPDCDGGRVVEDLNLPLKLPARLWVDAWRHHHHAFTYVRTLDLKTAGSYMINNGENSRGVVAGKNKG